MLIKLSPSRLKLATACERAYWARYILGQEDPSGAPALMGTCVHKGLESAFKYVQKNACQDVAELIQHAKNGYRTAWHHAGQIPLGELFQDGLDCLDRMAQLFPTLPAPEDVLGLEVRYEVPYETVDDLGSPVTVMFTGIVDMVARSGPGNEIVAHDWKTGWVVLQDEEMCRDAQAALYAMRLAEEYPDASSISTKWHYLRHGCTKTVEWDRAQLEEVKKWLLISGVELLDKAALGEEAFPATLNGACAWRTCRKDCPLMTTDPKEADVDPGDPGGLIDAYQAAGALEKAWKQNKERIYGMLMGHLNDGPIEHEGRRWAMGTRKYTSLDAQAVANIVDRYNLPPDHFSDAMKVSVPKAQALVSGLSHEQDEVRAELTAATETRHAPSLGSRKI